jgi:hypothetical protein
MFYIDTIQRNLDKSDLSGEEKMSPSYTVTRTLIYFRKKVRVIVKLKFIVLIY